MNDFIQQIVSQKIKTITPEELIQYAKKYHILLTIHESQKIISIVRRQKNLQIKNSSQLSKIIQEIEKEVSPALAKKAAALLSQFANIF